MAVIRKLRDLVVGLCMLLLGLLIVAKLEQQQVTTFKGPFFVVDGDTLETLGQRLRIQGIDAPEMGQQCQFGDGRRDCGQTARDELVGIVRGGGVTCEGGERDRYDRFLVTCRNGRGDIGQGLVREGLAVSYGRYGKEEKEARAARRGLWAGTFGRPQDFRKERDLEDSFADDWLSLLISWLTERI